MDNRPYWCMVLGANFCCLQKICHFGTLHCKLKQKPDMLKQQLHNFFCSYVSLLPPKQGNQNNTPTRFFAITYNSKATKILPFASLFFSDGLPVVGLVRVVSLRSNLWKRSPKTNTSSCSAPISRSTSMRQPRAKTRLSGHPMLTKGQKVQEPDQR